MSGGFRRLRVLLPRGLPPLPLEKYPAVTDGFPHTSEENSQSDGSPAPLGERQKTCDKKQDMLKSRAHDP